MRQLSFIETSAKLDFVEQLEDFRLYIKALDGIVATVLRDLKKRNSSVISLETLCDVVAALSSQCSLYHVIIEDFLRRQDGDQPKNLPPLAGG